jgi:hypothetical protein
MSYVRDKFIDPAGMLGTYSWQVNHSTEEANDRRRNIERSSPTAGVGFVRQQGEDSPNLLRYSGTILHQNQYDVFASYYDACRTRTIYFRDFTGAKSEVIVTDWSVQRVPTAHNPRDPSIPLHYYKYTIEMEVIRDLGSDFS